MSIIVTAPPPAIHHRARNRSEHVDFVLCGKILCPDKDALSGHGTKVTNDGLLATVSGAKVQFNRLYMVVPFKSKYVPKTGDIVVGRVVRLQKALWKFDVNHRLSANLRLENMNLPGGEQRRKDLEDEFVMSEYLSVSDLASLEVQQIRARGQVELHSRGLSHGKLGQGFLVKVRPSLIKPNKQHVHEMFGVMVIIADNGFVWISPGVSSAHNSADFTSAVPLEKRKSMVRIGACVRLLAKCLFCISDKTIIATYKLSLAYNVEDLTRPEILQALVPKLGQLLLSEEENRTEEA